MLASINWLKEYVDIDITPEELGKKLTMSGTDVETVKMVCEELQGVITGKIAVISKHPNADKLNVCTVDIGNGILKTIITSAKNVFEGAIVPVAVSGATIAGGQVMENIEFRGIESEGMFCSIKEMGLNTALFSKEILEGIYIFENNIKPGLDVKSLMWIDDSILNLEITANRSDCQSIYGIAKETAATLNKTVKEVIVDTSYKNGLEIYNYLDVKVESDLCPRYIAKMYKILKIEPSPLWMQLKLLNSGIRPINNIVDVTNFVMVELGQPLHAFDYKSLNSKEIVVRTTSDHKTVITLDEKEREIDPEMLMITNGKYPVAVAGIMGGANSEITENTEYVVLESACFDKTNVRLSGKKLGLRTEASSRYEKGLYPELAELAADRVSYLLTSIGACTPIDGMIDRFSKKTNCAQIDVSINWVNRFLGLNLNKKEILGYLERLFLIAESVDEDIIRVSPPIYRQDLIIKEDIAEEIARMYGYDNIPNTIMSGATIIGSKTEYQKFIDYIKTLLIGAGYCETLTMSFTSESKTSQLKLDKNLDIVKLINPLGEENSIMRNSLFTHQLDVVTLNANRNNPSGRFFEIAQTYHKNINLADLPIEKKKLALSSYGECDFYDMKGVIELLFGYLGITNYEFLPQGGELFHPYRKSTIYINSEKIGELGEVHPIMVGELNLPKRTYLCELDVRKMFDNSNSVIKYSDLPKYPSSTRDIAVVLNEDIPVSSIEKIIVRNSRQIIESINLFDVYRGEQIQSDKKSVAYSIVFRHPERTLTDEDINPIMENILEELDKKLAAHLRD